MYSILLLYSFLYPFRFVNSSIGLSPCSYEIMEVIHIVELDQ